MHVTFDCAGQLCTISERAAYLVHQKLRLIGAGRIAVFSVDAPLMGGATAVADLIEEVQAGRRAEPIPLGGKAAEAVYQAARLCAFEALDHPSAAALLEALYLQRSAPQR